MLIEADGSLVAWGGQCTWQPPCFQQVVSSADGAWAAVREVGDVVTWGEVNQCDIRVPWAPKFCLILCDRIVDQLPMRGFPIT